MTFFEVISSIYCRANYYLELMPEKKHQQDADALNGSFTNSVGK
jgi:hypothetical protein